MNARERQTQRYHTDPAYREHRKALTRTWTANNSARKQAIRRKALTGSQLRDG